MDINQFTYTRLLGQIYMLMSSRVCGNPEVRRHDEDRRCADKDRQNWAELSRYGDCHCIDERKDVISSKSEGVTECRSVSAFD